MSSEPLLDVIPIKRREQDGAIITQFDMGACETLGLLKMDFLGLRNLTVLDDCAGQHRGQPRRDARARGPRRSTTDADLRAARPRRHARRLPARRRRRCARCCARCGRTTFEDISAVVALYRPGPMGANAHNDYADRKNGRKPVVPIHPELAEPLAEILGRDLRADRLPGAGHGDRAEGRRLLARPGRPAAPRDGQEEEARSSTRSTSAFSAGMKANGYSAGAIKTLWDILLPFSDYAFNKAHSAGYGLVSYWTAYLKANYPAEYMAALLTSVRDDKDKSALYLAECRRMGIKVLPPDVNESDANFTPRRHRHPVRAVRDPQRRRERRRVDRRDPAREGHVRRLRRLPAQGRGGRLQQEDRRVADQGRRLRLARAHPARAARRPRDRDRRGPGHQAGRGDRPVRPVRLGGDEARPATCDAFELVDPGRRVGQDGPARASSARCSGSTSPTTRCSASSTCSPASVDAGLATVMSDETRPDGSVAHRRRV